MTSARRLPDSFNSATGYLRPCRGNEIFRYADDPWREAFFRFIAENPGATFHHAVMSDGVNIVYCRDQDKGMWFLPGSGMGPLQATGRRMMSEIIRGQR